MMAESNKDFMKSYRHGKELGKRPSDSQDGGREAKRKNTGNYPLVKLLVPNYAAGAIIGKGGTCLHEIKEKFGGFVRLSAGREYYPGTEERVVVITGEVNQLIDINNLVMEKVRDPGRDSTMKNVPIDVERGKKVMIVLTTAAAGMLIGRSGATIKGIQEESKAKISVGMPDKASVPGEQVVTVSGSFDECSKACRQIIEKISVETGNMANTKTKYISGNTDMYATHSINTGYNAGVLRNEGHISSSFDNRQQQDSRSQYLPANGMSSYQRVNNVGSSRKLKANVQIDVQVANVLVGAILGKQGSIIKDFVQRSGGARFKVLDRSDEDEGDIRTLRITGSLDQTLLAYSLVNDRVEQLQNQPTSQGF